MAKNDLETIAILGAVGVGGYFLVKTLSRGVSEAVGGVGSGIGEAGRSIGDVSRDVERFIYSFGRAGEQVLSSAGNVAQQGIQQIPQAVSFPFRLGTQIGAAVTDVFTGSDMTNLGHILQSVRSRGTATAEARKQFNSPLVNFVRGGFFSKPSSAPTPKPTQAPSTPSASSILTKIKNVVVARAKAGVSKARKRGR